MLDPIKLGTYILFFIPGFIFVQTIEHHLLREKKPQFEKTLEIILWSAAIWTISVIFPIWWPWHSARGELVNGINAVIQNDPKLENIFSKIIELNRSSIRYFFTVCIWSFIIANLLGWVRKEKYLDAIIKWITGRDWYPSVAFRFYKENLDKLIEVRTDKERYIGILYSAPDTQNDNYIIITSPCILKDVNGKTNKIPLEFVDSIVFRLDEINIVRAYKENLIPQKTDKIKREEGC